MSGFHRIRAFANHTAILCAAVLLVGCAASPSQLSEAAAENLRQQVLARFEQLADAAQRLDHDGYFALFDRQRFTALMADGTTLDSFNKFREIYLQGIAPVDRYVSLSFDPVQVTVLSDSVAVLMNEFEAQLILKSGKRVTASGAGSQIWQRTGNQWLLVSIASSNPP